MDKNKILVETLKRITIKSTCINFYLFNMLFIDIPTSYELDLK